MFEFVLANKDVLLVFASFLGASAAFYAAFNFSRAQAKNRRAAIREKLVGEFRLAVAELLALADRTRNRQHQQSEEDEPDLWADLLAFYKADNAIELLIAYESDEKIEEFRDAIQNLKIAYSTSDGEFEARSKVVSMSKRFVREQLKRAGDGE